MLKTFYKKVWSSIKPAFKKKLAGGGLSPWLSHPLWRLFQTGAVRLLGFAQRNIKLLLSLLAAFLLADLLLIKSYNFLLPDKNLPPLSFARYSSAQGRSPELYKSIWENNIFHTGPIPQKLEESPVSSDPVLSSLPFKLKGTIVHADPRRSVATITAGAQTLAYQQGGEIEKQAEVREIQRGKVIFLNQNNNRLEYIVIPEDQKPPLISYIKDKPKISESLLVRKTGTDKFQVKRSDINDYLRKLPEILHQARVVPQRSKDGQMGWQFAYINKGSVFEDLGFAKGDIIKEVDGEPVQSPDKALELFDRLKKSNGFKILVEKNGQDVYYEYNVDENAVPL